MFGKLNLEEMCSEKQRVTSGDNGFLEQFVPMPKGPGVLSVRILPPLQDKRLFQYNRLHSINGRRVHCRRPLKQGLWDRSVKCPTCELYQSLWKKADRCTEKGQKTEAEAFKDEARQLKPLERYYYNVIVRQLTDENGQLQQNVGPRILSVGKSLHGIIVTAIVGGETSRGKGNVADLQTGFDLIIRKEEKGGFANYDKSQFADGPSPAGTKDEIDRWATKLHDLSALRNPKSVDDLEREIAIYRNIIPDDSDFDIEAIEAKYRPNEVGESAPSNAASATEVAPVKPEDCGDADTPEPQGSQEVSEADDLADPAFMNDFAAELEAMERHQ